MASGLSGCLKIQWLPRVRLSLQPSRFKRAMISRLPKVAILQRTYKLEKK